MRILVLIHEYPPVGGGGGKVAEDIAEGLVNRGHEVQVITSRLPGLAKKELRGGVEIIRVQSGRKYAYKATFWSMALFIIMGFFRALKETQDWKPDVIHVHFAVPAGVLGWAVSKVTGIPYILTAHLGDVPGGVPDKTDKWFKWVSPFTPVIWKKAKRVVAVSSFTRDLALQHYPVKVDVIPNGVNIQEYDPGTVEVHNPVRILFVGRTVPQKNPLQVIRILGAVKDLDWKCTVVGDGSLKKEMEIQANNLGITERVEFTGWINQQEVKEWFAKSDILLMPSLSEGLPVVGVQALSMGLAFVVSNVGGFLDLVRNGENGWMHDPAAMEEFSRSIRFFLENPTRLMDCKQNSRKIAHEFDLVRIIDEYESIFIGVVKK